MYRSADSYLDSTQETCEDEMSMEWILFAIIAIPCVLLITNAACDRVYFWYMARPQPKPLTDYISLDDVEL